MGGIQGCVELGQFVFFPVGDGVVVGEGAVLSVLAPLGGEEFVAKGEGLSVCGGLGHVMEDIAFEGASVF